MVSKNVSGQGVYLFAYTLSTALAKTGDAANITGAISKDGAASAATATANPTEIGAGIYWQPLSQGETNCNALSISWASSTSGVLIRPITALTDRGSVPSDIQTIKTQAVTAAAGVTFPTSIASPTNITAAAGVALSSAGLDLVVAETSINARQAIALILDAVASILSGASGTTVTIRNPANSADRIVATVDASGNRSAVTLTPPA